MDRGFASRLRIPKLLEEKDKHFILRVKNNMTLEMLENGRCKLGKGKRQVEVRVVAFCDLESRTEFRIATDLPLEGKGAVSNEEIGEMYRQRWQIELLCYLILQLIDIAEDFGKSLLDKLRYLQSFMCQHISYVHWFRKIVYSI